MAKFVALVCMALLVATADSARLLKQYADAGVTAATFPSGGTPAEVFAVRTEVPVAEYNYNLIADPDADTTPTTATPEEEVFADEGEFTTEGTLVGETRSDPSPSENYVFDAHQQDEPVFNPDDPPTPQDLGTLADEGVVQPMDDPTSLATDTVQQFEFQETPTDDVSQGDGPGIFAFDDSLQSP